MTHIFKNLLVVRGSLLPLWTLSRTRSKLTPLPYPPDRSFSESSSLCLLTNSSNLLTFPPSPICPKAKFLLYCGRVEMSLRAYGGWGGGEGGQFWQLSQNIARQKVSANLPPVSMTGWNLPSVSMTPAANLPPVSTTPVSNNRNTIRLLTP